MEIIDKLHTYVTKEPETSIKDAIAIGFLITTFIILMTVLTVGVYLTAGGWAGVGIMWAIIAFAIMFSWSLVRVFGK